jgi:hypothetical protein
MAASSGHFQVVKILLKAGASLDTYVPELGTPLISATLGARYEIAELLLDNNADFLMPIPDTNKELLSFVLNKSNDNKLLKLFLKEKIRRDIKSVDTEIKKKSEQENHNTKDTKEKEILLEKIAQNKFAKESYALESLELISNVLTKLHPGYRKDGSLKISLKHKAFKGLVPLALKDETQITISLEKQIYIHSNFINGSIVTNQDTFKKQLLSMYLKHCKEKVDAEEKERKTTIEKLKSNIFDLQQEVLRMPEQFFKLLTGVDKLVSHIETCHSDLLDNIETRDAKLEAKLTTICNVDMLRTHSEDLAKEFDEIYEKQSTEILRLTKEVLGNDHALLQGYWLEKTNVSLRNLREIFKEANILNKKLEIAKNALSEFEIELEQQAAEQHKIEAAKQNHQRKIEADQIKLQKIALEKMQKRKEDIQKQEKLKEARRLNAKALAERQTQQVVLLKKQREFEIKAKLEVMKISELTKSNMAIVVQFKGNVNNQLVEFEKARQAKIDVDLKVQTEILQQILKLFNTFPDPTLLLPEELYIVRYSILYCTAIVAESLKQNGKGHESIFSTDLRNFLFIRSQELFAEIDYKDVDSYIDTNKQLIQMVTQMINFALDTTGKAVLNSNLYQEIIKVTNENFLSDKELPYCLQQIGRDSHTLFRLKQYMKTNGIFTKNPLILETALRFTIGRLGKYAKNLRSLQPELYNILNRSYGNRYDFYIHHGRRYRHIQSLEQLLHEMGLMPAFTANGVAGATAAGISPVPTPISKA